MKNKIFYYTVELLTQPGEGYYDDYDDLTGEKLISIYEIKDNIPIELTLLNVRVEKNSKEEASVWLDENGYFREEFELKRI